MDGSDEDPLIIVEISFCFNVTSVYIKSKQFSEYIREACLLVLNVDDDRFG